MSDLARRPTIRDVAELSGVSSQTVSRVINGDPHVSKKTRQRVLKAIDDLSYLPNRAAQSLVTRRSRTLEVITFGTTHYGPSQMVAHIEAEAQAAGYNLIFSSIPNVTSEEIRKAIDNLSGRLVDGIIMITPILGASHDELSALCRGTPFLQVDIEQGANVPSVVIDQRYGSWLVTQHLLALGHRKICEISGPLNWFGANSRSQSWRDALRAAGVEPGMSVEGDWTAGSGYQMAYHLLDAGAEFTALVAGNDQMALGAMLALDERGLRVPEDISVVGFDDIPEAAYFKPPLTTVRQDFGALGKQCVEYLIGLINRPDLPPHQRVLKPQLALRHSTAEVTVPETGGRP